MNNKLLLALTFVFFYSVANAQQTVVENSISLKTPGNPAKTYELKDDGTGILMANQRIPITIAQKRTEGAENTKVEITITAQEKVYFNFEEVVKINAFTHNDCEFYMPGFWYHKNLRSPKEAPSFATSDSWQVREDRLSTPLTGIFDNKTGQYYTVIRIDQFKNESLTTHNQGEVIFSGKTSLGFTGFRNVDGNAALVFGFPYHEAPKTYIRKLKLNPSVQAFEKLEKNESKTLVWEIRKGRATDYSAFIAQAWTYSYDTYQPKAVSVSYTNAEAKKTLSNFFTESYVGDQDLKYFSGVHLRTDDCKSTGVAELGFVGRVLLNAYNALEYGEQNNVPDLVQKANAIYDSYLSQGFTNNGFFREFVDYKSKNKKAEEVLSIRRQSEAVFAVLNYLAYEKKKGRKHTEWEAKIKQVLANFTKLQNADGSFPRKFDDQLKIIDASGGSTPSATLPLTMAYGYFKHKSYLSEAKKTAVYLEKEIISKSDYFSSTLDANCEDKEASLYASTAMYYLAMVTTGNERDHYVDQSQKAAYFCLSWYYTWDVPFAQGQMLGDVNFKSRGWGNVSVENNHIDVFIFEFATVLDWLAKEKSNARFADFAAVIKSSMLQLMPDTGHMYDIAKIGYYPEVVQHTNWDYGKNGKGFYNDIFAPGWTVASLWQMLSPTRVSDFFNKK
ncbi:hypothetical protein [Pedobacter ureilyticus]|uniref:Uncharacterized protein n=1 Tax=Pedobacter ureilyticus TaxID=1393051 RepID=A0ABW9J831_9SPHI|nr:hypothetical protein [Pedobacter helvus]